MDKTTPKKRKDRTAMPCQPANVRSHNFDEVALGYTLENALDEASRCLHCKKPLCVEGCPVCVPIPEFIKAVKEQNLEEAYRLLKTANALPAVCGRVCPQENQCEGRCILGRKGEPVAIGRLERFVADTHIAKSACEQQTGTNACSTRV